MSIPVLSRFARFTAAGGIGFLIEAVILTWLVQGQGLNIYAARLVSFSVAVTATWAINRNFAFAGLKQHRKGREYSAYFLVQIIGAAINLGIFATVVAIRPGLRSIPVFPLAIGAAVALVFNFVASRTWIFRGKDE
jgi:putative flippase GtrA